MKFQIGQLVRTRQGIGRITALSSLTAEDPTERETHYFIKFENGSKSDWKAEHLLREVK